MLSADRLKIREALVRAMTLAEIAGDWNLNEVEIDGMMVQVSELGKEFQEAIRLLYADTLEKSS